MPSGARIWLMAARPRTLPAAVAPVLVGTALAGQAGVFHPLTFIATLVGAVFIQVGTNLSNDYSDARRGADTEDRLGPVRVTAGGLVPPRRAPAGRAAGPAPCVPAVRADGVRRVLPRAPALGARFAVRVAAAALAGDAACRAAGPHGGEPHRRPDAQRRARAHGNAPARLLPAAVGGHSVVLMDVELERVTYRFRQPITTAYGTLTEREVLVLRLRDDDGNEGLGEAAPPPSYH